ncbi:MAG: zinc ribbon domain-containing protein, partial [Myxococcales bacterium]
MICANCRSDLEDGARFCGACGTRVTTESDFSRTSTSDSGASRLSDAEVAKATALSDSAPTRNLDIPSEDSGPASASPAPAPAEPRTPHEVPPSLGVRSLPPGAKVGDRGGGGGVGGGGGEGVGLDATMLAAPTSPPPAGGSAPLSGSLAPKRPSTAAETAPGFGQNLKSGAAFGQSEAGAPLKPAAGPAPAPNLGAWGNAGGPERKTENSGSRDDMVGRTLNKRYVVGEKVGEGGF